MKLELKLTSEDITDESKVEAAFRATDLVFSLKEIYQVLKDSPNREVLDPVFGRLLLILDSAGVRHLVND